MRIIVAQRYPPDIPRVRAAIHAISPARASEIFYTTLAQEVLEQVRLGDPVLIVCGKVLDDLSDTLVLARIAKEVSPRTLFFLFSVAPDHSECVDGIIPKLGIPSGHDLLSRILASDLEGVTPAGLKRQFPEIEIGPWR